MKKLKISQLAPGFRYLQTLALKKEEVSANTETNLGKRLLSMLELLGGVT